MHSDRSPRFLVAAGAFALAAAAGSAHADESTTTSTTTTTSSHVTRSRARPSDLAKSMRKNAQSLRAQRNFDGALALLQLIDDLGPTPSSRIDLADVFEAKGDLGEAYSVLASVESLPVPDKESAADHRARVVAKARSVALSARIARVAIMLTKPVEGCAFFLDGKELPASLVNKPIGLNPGRHAVSALRNSKLTRQEFSVVEGEVRDVFLGLEMGATDLKGEREAAERKPTPASAAPIKRPVQTKNVEPAPSAPAPSKPAPSKAPPTKAAPSNPVPTKATPSKTAKAAPSKHAPSKPEARHVPVVVPISLWAGGGALVVGTITGGLALAGANNPDADPAKQSALTTTAGITLGIGGAAVLLGGVVWIVHADSTPKKETAGAVQLRWSGTSAGLDATW